MRSPARTSTPASRHASSRHGEQRLAGGERARAPRGARARPVRRRARPELGIGDRAPAVRRVADESRARAPARRRRPARASGPRPGARRDARSGSPDTAAPPSGAASRARAGPRRRATRARTPRRARRPHRRARASACTRAPPRPSRPCGRSPEATRLPRKAPSFPRPARAARGASPARPPARRHVPLRAPPPRPDHCHCLHAALPASSPSRNACSAVRGETASPATISRAPPRFDRRSERRVGAARGRLRRPPRTAASEPPSCGRAASQPHRPRCRRRRYSARGCIRAARSGR